MLINTFLTPEHVKKILIFKGLKLSSLNEDVAHNIIVIIIIGVERKLLRLAYYKIYPDFDAQKR